MNIAITAIDKKSKSWHFVIEVETNSKKWTVKRPYSQFHALSQDLKKEKIIFLVKFPAKRASMTASMAQNVASDRQEKLHKWIKEVFMFLSRRLVLPLSFVLSFCSLGLVGDQPVLNATFLREIFVN